MADCSGDCRDELSRGELAYVVWLFLHVRSSDQRAELMQTRYPTLSVGDRAYMERLAERAIKAGSVANGLPPGQAVPTEVIPINESAFGGVPPEIDTRYRVQIEVINPTTGVVDAPVYDMPTSGQVPLEELIKELMDRIGEGEDTVSSMLADWITGQGDPELPSGDKVSVRVLSVERRGCGDVWLLLLLCVSPIVYAVGLLIRTLLLALDQI